MIHHAKDARKQSEIAAKGILEQELNRIEAIIIIERAIKEGKTSVETLKISEEVEKVLKEYGYTVKKVIFVSREDYQSEFKISW